MNDLVRTLSWLCDNAAVTVTLVLLAMTLSRPPSDLAVTLLRDNREGDVVVASGLLIDAEEVRRPRRRPAALEYWRRRHVMDRHRPCSQPDARSADRRRDRLMGSEST